MVMSKKNDAKNDLFSKVFMNKFTKKKKLSER